MWNCYTDNQIPKQLLIKLSLLIKNKYRILFIDLSISLNNITQDTSNFIFIHVMVRLILLKIYEIRDLLKLKSNVAATQKSNGNVAITHITITALRRVVN